jgi:hypothetical protein
MIIKLFNNSNIEIREDGYFNATAMCKAFGKQTKDYLKSEGTKAFLDALETRRTNILLSLVETKNGGVNPGTWIERRVAIDLARWLSPEFHVQVIEWTEEILSGQRPQLPNITSEDSYTTQMVDLFSRTITPMQKEVILKNTASETPPTRRIDMKVHGKNIYYEVKMHRITMSDLSEVFFNRKYPDLLKELHSNNFKLYLVSPQGINEEAKYFIGLMSNVYFIHGEDLALEAAYNLLQDEVARVQMIKHILPQYACLLPRNWKELINGAKELTPSPKIDESLLYTNELPLGVWVGSGQIKPYHARFQYLGVIYNLGSYSCPLEAGHVVKTKMIEVKGLYEMPKCSIKLSQTF